MRDRALHRVPDDDGGDPVQDVRDGAQDVREEGVHGGHGHGATHENDARVQECHQTELHHKVGGGRERKSGQHIYIQNEVLFRHAKIKNSFYPCARFFNAKTRFSHFLHFLIQLS